MTFETYIAGPGDPLPPQAAAASPSSSDGRGGRPPFSAQVPATCKRVFCPRPAAHRGYCSGCWEIVQAIASRIEAGDDL